MDEQLSFRYGIILNSSKMDKITVTIALGEFDTVIQLSFINEFQSDEEF